MLEGIFVMQVYMLSLDAVTRQDLSASNVAQMCGLVFMISFVIPTSHICCYI